MSAASSLVEINGTYVDHTRGGSYPFDTIVIAGEDKQRSVTVTFDAGSGLPAWGPFQASWDGTRLALYNTTAWNGKAAQYFEASVVDLPRSPGSFSKLLKAIFSTYLTAGPEPDPTGDPESTGVWGAKSNDPPHPGGEVR